MYFVSFKAFALQEGHEKKRGNNVLPSVKNSGAIYMVGSMSLDFQRLMVLWTGSMDSIKQDCTSHEWTNGCVCWIESNSLSRIFDSIQPSEDIERTQL